MPHERALAELAGADFSVFFRPDNRVSQVGFPTKYVEAACCGIPTVTNRTSDLGRYLRDGDNGFLAATADPDAVLESLRKAVTLGAAELEAMKVRVRADNPFHYAHWTPAMAAFMQRLGAQA